MSETQSAVPRIEPTAGDPVSHRIIETISRRTGRGIEELPQLYDVVDPEALDTIFRGGDTFVSGQLSFEYADHLITISVDGTIEIDSV